MKVRLLAVIFLTACCAAAEGSGPQTERKTLDAPTVIQGYPCARGYAWFYHDGALRSCAVSKEIQFGEATAPSGSRIHLTPAGKPDFVFLSGDAKVAGHECRGGGESPCNRN